MDCVDNAVFVVEPHFIAPFFRVSGAVLCSVVIDQVAVADIGVECRVFEGREDWHFVGWLI